MNASFPIELYDRLVPARPGESIILTADDAKRLREFLVGMNKLDLLLQEVELEKLEGPKADELRQLLRRTK